MNRRLFIQSGLLALPLSMIPWTDAEGCRRRPRRSRHFCPPRCIRDVVRPRLNYIPPNAPGWDYSDSDKRVQWVTWYWDYKYDEGDSFISSPCWIKLNDNNRYSAFMEDCVNDFNPFPLGFYFGLAPSPGASVTVTVAKMCTRNFNESGRATSDGRLDWGYRGYLGYRDILVL
jgi:hypothetical protein